jgi:hypothetical protein
VAALAEAANATPATATIAAVSFFIMLSLAFFKKT